MQGKAETILEGCFKEADHLGNLDDVGGEKIKALDLNVMRGSIASKEGFSLAFKYSEPLGYLISLIFPLPLLGRDG